MEDNLKIYNMIKKVPDEAQKKITGGRLSGMTDIKPMWRIEKLTEIFGPCGLGWYTTTRNREIIDGANGEKIAVVDINLFVNYKKPFELNEDLWSEAIEGTGGSSFIAKEKNGLCANLIIDGQIIHESLRIMHKDEEWLKHELKVKGFKIDEVILATLDLSENFKVYGKNVNSQSYDILN